MIVNSQLPQIYDPGQRTALPVESAVNKPSNPPQSDTPSQQVRPVTWTENLERARDYTLKAQASDDSLSQRGKAALSAYSSHEKNDERSYLTEVFGLDTFA
ncbi:MAG: hypothetical protein L3J28_01620 [Candidatus Polarisedimenticolaceae bacterium]|nr:hypothetical protein [Candidatus Polarisedimenticolaceae bacterium]